jgi:hypothetical protein
VYAAFVIDVLARRIVGRHVSKGDSYKKAAAIQSVSELHILSCEISKAS